MAEGQTAIGTPGKLFDVPIDALGLSGRARGSLERAGITSVGDVLILLAKGESQVLDIPRFGPKSLVELKANLRENGYLPEAALVAEAEDVTAEAVPVEVIAPATEEAAAPEPEAKALPEEPTVPESEVEAVAEEAEPEEALPEAEQPAPETPGEPQEQVPEPVPELTQVEDDLEVEEEEDRAAKPKRRRRRRDLIFDERTGRVVSRPRRKASRSRDEWRQWVGEVDEDDLEP